MATRLVVNRDFYTTLQAFTPDAGWERTTGFIRYKMSTTKVTTSPHSSLFTIGPLAAQGTSGNDTLLFQGVSDPLDIDQTITGNVKGQARFLESVATLDARAQVAIWIAKPDGTSRGTLLVMSAGALASEFATTLTNRKTPIGGSVALGSVAALAGDRIIYELGARQHATVAGNLSLSIGYAATDLPEDETTTAANAPWLEFDQNITFTQEAAAMVTTAGLEVAYQPSTIPMRATTAGLEVAYQPPNRAMRVTTAGLEVFFRVGEAHGNQIIWWD